MFALAGTIAALVAFAIAWKMPLPEWRLAGGLAALCALIAGADLLAIVEIVGGGDDGKRLKATLIGASLVGVSVGYFANWIWWAIRDSAKSEEG